jgi:acetyl-CoA acetyltransferase
LPTVRDYAIAGLGVTRQGTLPGSTSEGLAWEAVELALEDAGLSRRDVDGYLFQPGIGGQNSGLAATRAGLSANVVLELQSGGATALLALATAVGLIESGVCTVVACAHGTNARTRSVRVGEGRRSMRDPNAVHGYLTPGANAAMWAQAYFSRYGGNPGDLGEIAVALRAHAAVREDATMFGRPITLEDYRGSEFIVEPLRKLDYCLVTDGGAAFIVTTRERARDLSAPPVAIRSLGAAHSAGLLARDRSVFADPDLDLTPMREGVLGRAGLSIEDINVFQFYDAFTILVARQLEAWGLCGPGEAADFVRAGNFGHASAVPCNTSGTEHSWSYLQGFTHISEAVRQLRGLGGPTQVASARTALVTGMGATDAGQSQAAAVLSI